MGAPDVTIEHRFGDKGDGGANHRFLMHAALLVVLGAVLVASVPTALLMYANFRALPPLVVQTAYALGSVSFRYALALVLVRLLAVHSLGMEPLTNYTTKNRLLRCCQLRLLLCCSFFKTRVRHVCGDHNPHCIR